MEEAWEAVVLVDLVHAIHDSRVLLCDVLVIIFEKNSCPDQVQWLSDGATGYVSSHRRKGRNRSDSLRALGRRLVLPRHLVLVESAQLSPKPTVDDVEET